MKKNLKKLILFPNHSISDGLKKLDESGLQIIIITDEDNNLIGVSDFRSDDFLSIGVNKDG